MGSHSKSIRSLIIASGMHQGLFLEVMRGRKAIVSLIVFLWEVQVTQTKRVGPEATERGLQVPTILLVLFLPSPEPLLTCGHHSGSE